MVVIKNGRSDDLKIGIMWPAIPWQALGILGLGTTGAGCLVEARKMPPLVWKPCVHYPPAPEPKDFPDSNIFGEGDYFIVADKKMTDKAANLYLKTIRQDSKQIRGVFSDDVSIPKRVVVKIKDNGGLEGNLDIERDSPLYINLLLPVDLANIAAQTGIVVFKIGLDHELVHYFGMGRTSLGCNDDKGGRNILEEGIAEFLSREINGGSSSAQKSKLVSTYDIRTGGVYDVEPTGSSIKVVGDDDDAIYFTRDKKETDPHKAPYHKASYNVYYLYNDKAIIHFEKTQDEQVTLKVFERPIVYDEKSKAYSQYYGMLGGFFFGDVFKQYSECGEKGLRHFSEIQSSDGKIQVAHETEDAAPIIYTSSSNAYDVGQCFWRRIRNLYGFSAVTNILISLSGYMSIHEQCEPVGYIPFMEIVRNATGMTDVQVQGYFQSFDIQFQACLPIVTLTSK